MPRVVLVLMIVATALHGCASSPPAPAPRAQPHDHVRRLAVVVSGESAFVLEQHRAEPGRTFDEVLKWWMPYGPMLRPLAELAHRGINRFLDADRTASVRGDIRGVYPPSVVAEALARRLEGSGRFVEIQTMEREPLGEDRRRADAIARVAVPAWGLVRVQSGASDLVSTFADVRLQLVIPETGVIAWSGSEDVTHPERFPLESFTRDGQLLRQELLAVLERAGQRLASELLYAGAGGR